MTQQIILLHANIERVNGGFVVFSPFNSTLEMQQVMSDFVRLCSRVGVLAAKKHFRDKEYQKPFPQTIGLQIFYEYTPFS